MKIELLSLKCPCGETIYSVNIHLVEPHSLGMVGICPKCQSKVECVTTLSNLYKTCTELSQNMVDTNLFRQEQFPTYESDESFLKRVHIVIPKKI